VTNGTHGRRITESHTVEGGVVIPTPQILISHTLWSQWGEIAIERENRARRARAELLARHHHGQDAAPQMYAEFLASLVAISAAAHGLDALYGHLVTDEIRTAGPKDKVSREAHIRECLRRRFDTGQRDRNWVTKFRWLFDLRNAAAHPEVKLLPAVPHLSGVSNTGQMAADYSVEGAMRAVDLLIDVLTTCRDKPKPDDKGARHWADSFGPSIGALVTQLGVGRDARPLAI